MKPGKNLRDRLASQTGAPMSGGGQGADGGLNKLIESERAKRREASEAAGEAAPKKKATAAVPPATAPRTNKNAGAKGAGKSTTNQGLR